MNFLKFIKRVHTKKAEPENSSMKKIDDWSNSLTQIREYTTIEELKFVFEQAEKQLQDTNETSQLIVSRATTLLTLMSGFLITIVGFGIKLWIDNSKDSLEYYNELILTTIIIGCYTFYISIVLTKNIKGVGYKILGAEPMQLFIKKYYTINDTKFNRRLRMMYISEIISYQKKITYNININETRWKSINNVIMLIILLPVLLVFSYTCLELFF